MGSWAISWGNDGGTGSNGSNADLSQLIRRPDQSPNSSIKGHRWGNEGVNIPHAQQHIICVGEFRILQARGSIANANNRGDSGQPCHVPLVSLNDLEGCQL